MQCPIVAITTFESGTDEPVPTSLPMVVTSFFARKKRCRVANAELANETVGTIRATRRVLASSYMKADDLPEAIGASNQGILLLAKVLSTKFTI